MLRRHLLLASCGLLLLFVTFFIGVHYGAKYNYFHEGAFEAFKTMIDLEALRDAEVQNKRIEALIAKKETDLDMELSTVSMYQKSGLEWLNFLFPKTSDAIFLRSIADYRQRYPSRPMVTEYLSKEQRKFISKVHSDILKEQNSLLQKYR